MEWYMEQIEDDIESEEQLFEEFQQLQAAMAIMLREESIVLIHEDSED